MMKNFTALLIFIFISFGIKGQSNDTFDFSHEIDSMVWEPFKEAYLKKDGPLYVSLHTDDILRPSPWGIQQGQEWKTKTLANFAQEGRKSCVIDFVFEHRIHEEDIAYEVGYYKLYYLPKEEKGEAHYGRFHVVLKNIDGTWKITQDWDSGNINGHEVGEDDFSRLKNK